MKTIQENVASLRYCTAFCLQRKKENEKKLFAAEAKILCEFVNFCACMKLESTVLTLLSRIAHFLPRLPMYFISFVGVTNWIFRCSDDIFNMSLYCI